MRITNTEYWDTVANSEYNKSIIDYAKRWAEAMEKRFDAGEKVADIADETSFSANDSSMSGYSYGLAVSLLSETWQHGEELRQWHNLKFSPLGGEEVNKEPGAVINPAIYREYVE